MRGRYSLQSEPMYGCAVVPQYPVKLSLASTATAVLWPSASLPLQSNCAPGNGTSAHFSGKKNEVPRLSIWDNGSTESSGTKYQPGLRTLILHTAR